MLLQQKVEVKLSSTTKKFWENKGYFGKCGTTILVDSEELPNNSHVIEERECDCCHKKYCNTHQKLNRSHISFDADYCPECVKNNSQIAILKKNKSIKTSQEKYGTDSPNQSEVVKLNKETSCLQKYGVTSPNKLQDKINKTKQSYIKKYGVDHPAKTKEFHEKIHNSMLQNGTTPTSNPQIQLFELLKSELADSKVELNSPLSKLMLDILITTKDGIKIDVEYDGWYWHQDKQKDYKRDCFVKNQGYKILRIKSASLIPSKEELLYTISDMILNNKTYTSIVLSDYKES